MDADGRASGSLARKPNVARSGRSGARARPGRARVNSRIPQGCELDRLDDRRVALATDRVDEVGVVDEHAEVVAARRGAARQEQLDALRADGAEALAAGPGDLEAQHVAVPALRRSDVRHGKLRRDGPPHLQLRIGEGRQCWRLRRSTCSICGTPRRSMPSFTAALGVDRARLAEGGAARIDRHAVDAGHDVVAAQAEPLERAVAEQVHHRHAAQLAVVVVHRREARLLRDVCEHLVVARARQRRRLRDRRPARARARPAAVRRGVLRGALRACSGSVAASSASFGAALAGTSAPACGSPAATPTRAPGSRAPRGGAAPRTRSWISTTVPPSSSSPTRTARLAPPDSTTASERDASDDTTVPSRRSAAPRIARVRHRLLRPARARRAPPRATARYAPRAVRARSASSRPSIVSSSEQHARRVGRIGVPDARRAARRPGRSARARGGSPRRGASSRRGNSAKCRARELGLDALAREHGSLVHLRRSGTRSAVKSTKTGRPSRSSRGDRLRVEGLPARGRVTGRCRRHGRRAARATAGAAPRARPARPRPRARGRARSAPPLAASRRSRSRTRARPGAPSAAASASTPASRPKIQSVQHGAREQREAEHDAQLGPSTAPSAAGSARSPGTSATAASGARARDRSPRRSARSRTPSPRRRSRPRCRGTAQSTAWRARPRAGRRRSCGSQPDALSPTPASEVGAPISNTPNRFSANPTSTRRSRASKRGSWNWKPQPTEVPAARSAITTAASASIVTSHARHVAERRARAPRAGSARELREREGLERQHRQHARHQVQDQAAHERERERESSDPAPLSGSSASRARSSATKRTPPSRPRSSSTPERRASAPSTASVTGPEPDPLPASEVAMRVARLGNERRRRDRAAHREPRANGLARARRPFDSVHADVHAQRRRRLRNARGELFEQRVGARRLRARHAVRQRLVEVAGQLDLAGDALVLADQEVGVDARSCAGRARGKRDEVAREQDRSCVAVAREAGVRVAQHLRRRPRDRPELGRPRPRTSLRGQADLAGIAPVQVPARIQREQHAHARDPAWRRGGIDQQAQLDARLHRIGCGGGACAAGTGMGGSARAGVAAHPRPARTLPPTDSYAT